MSNFNFTPGPWFILDIEEIKKEKNPEKYICIGTSNKWNSTMLWISDVKSSNVGPKTFKEIFANAKLIAAAPDLLEALLNIENDDGQIPDTIWKMRNNAIKKATE